MSLKDIVAGTYGGLGNVLGVPVNAQAFRDYLEFNRRKVLGAVFGAMSPFLITGCTDCLPKPPDNGIVKPAPATIEVAGLSDIVNDNYVDVRPDKDSIQNVSINISDGTLQSVYWKQGQNAGIISYSGNVLNFNTLPGTGLFDIFVDASNSDGEITTEEISGLLSGPERSYFIGNETEFNSEFGSINSFLETNRFGGDIGDDFTSQYLRSDIDNIFENYPAVDSIANSSEFRAGKDSEGNAYVIASNGGYIVYEMSLDEFNQVYQRNLDLFGF